MFPILLIIILLEEAMNTIFIFKDTFSVIGKMGMGSAKNPMEWIGGIWEKANADFAQIQSIAKYDADGTLCGLWGAMSDVNERFERWSDEGKYLAGCEVTSGAVPPKGFTKWTIPAQTYVAVKTDAASYTEVWNYIINEYLPQNNLTIVAAQHERYPEAGNPNVVELYFPIAKGNCICQSCGMPLFNPADFGTEKDALHSMYYCHYCYENGAFTKDETMAQMIETCIPFEIEAGVYKNAGDARSAMHTIYPLLKRWQK